MRARLVYALLVGAALAGCAADYDPPEKPVPMPGMAGKPVLQTEIVTVSAFLAGASSSLAELNTAKCTLSRGGKTVVFMTPSKVAIPIHPGTQQALDLTCSAQIGPRNAESALRHLPEVATAAAEALAERHYPEQFTLRFKQ